MNKIAAVTVALYALLNSNLLSTSIYNGIMMPLLTLLALLYLLLIIFSESKMAGRDDSSIAAAGIVLADDETPGNEITNK